MTHHAVPRQRRRWTWESRAIAGFYTLCSPLLVFVSVTLGTGWRP